MYEGWYRYTSNSFVGIYNYVDNHVQCWILYNYVTCKYTGQWYDEKFGWSIIQDPNFMKYIIENRYLNSPELPANFTL